MACTDTNSNLRRYDYINPFVHSLHIDNTIDLAKIYILTVILVPIRTLFMLLFIFFAWAFAVIGQYGMTLEDINAKPLTGWRKCMQKLTTFSMRLVYASGSFHYIKKTGKQALAEEAPIVVVAPHSSYVDSLAVVLMGPSAIVAKQETSQIPFFGKIFNFAQPIYVAREDPNSRQTTIRKIIERVNSPENWPQISIFAEGTCTNRKALISFKNGAFYPGVPIQPVILRFQNKYDSYTWTWDGPGVLKLLWITLAQLYSPFEMEFLPVYIPSNEEKANATLYAQNVRNIMAKALNVPVTDYSFQDCIVMNKAKEMQVPFAADMIEIKESLKKLGLLERNIDDEIADNYFTFANDKIDFVAFTKLLKIDPNVEYTQRLFSLLNKTMANQISIRDYILCSFFVKKQNEAVIEYLRLVRKTYCENANSITREGLNNILQHSTRKTTNEKIDALFFNIDNTHKGSISFDDFETYVKEKPEYNYLFKQKDVLKRN